MSTVPFADIRAWMFEAALPFWAERGVDRADGGFYEELGPDGRPTDCSFKRVRMVCRQTYAFTHGALLGWKEGAALSDWGYQYLIEHARVGDGAWARTLTREGAVLDPGADLYDLSFVIFAMAWRYRFAGDAAARNYALETLNFIRTRMRAPNGGFWRQLPAEGVLAQNPHMHLAEACLAAFEATSADIFLETAREVVELFSKRFFNGATLGERFNPSWSRIPGAIEPGHQFEWVWILANYQRLTGGDVAALAARSAEFAERHGVDSNGAVYDAVSEEGAVLKGSSRVWTNTERIKAAIGLYELDGRDPRPALLSTTQLIFSRYFAGNIPGLWTDQFDAEGQALTSATPASCVYHLFLAFAEMLRLEGAILRMRE